MNIQFMDGQVDDRDQDLSVNLARSTVREVSGFFWLGADAFDCIHDIQHYENWNFGQVTTDLSEPEHVANMFVYVIGEQILEDVIKEFLDSVETELEAEESE